MTDQQLYLSIGIPSILILVSWFSNNIRFNSIEKRFEDRFKGVDTRFQSIENQLNDLRADLRILTAEVRDDVRRLNDLALDHAQRLTKLESRV